VSNISYVLYMILIIETGWTRGEIMLKLRPMSRSSSVHSPTFSPLYRQIKELILRHLESGEWGPGDPIPSESELAARFGVSQGTVRKAIDEMAAENLLVRQQGRGTFVATHKDPGSFFRFLRLVPNQGDLQVSQSVPLECWRAKAGADVARTLALETGAPITIRSSPVEAGRGAGGLRRDLPLRASSFPICRWRSSSRESPCTACSRRVMAFA
jgi:DNA-binding transcriptional regulator YhcF (GntR family)